MTLITLFSLFSALLLAPVSRTGVIFASEGVNRYEPLIRAVVMVESHNGKYLYNPDEGAVGWFQIRQIRVDHYNQLTGNSYQLDDFYDYELSRKMFLYYTKGRSYESVAKSWNGSGPMTKEYWKKINKHLNQ
jgi:hypothetical protein